jgi:hypothetical protein
MLSGVEIAAVAALVALARKAIKGECEPYTLEEMAATKRPVDNRIPEHFRIRALGLGVVAGRIRCLGIGRVTSTWRSPALTALIRAENAARGVNQGVKVFSGPGDHDQARGVDVAPPEPVKLKTPADKAAAREAIAKLRDQLLGSNVGPLIEKALAEDDHVHLRLDEVALEEIGKRFSAKVSS